MRKRILAEATGTFFLVLIGAGSVVLDAHSNGRLGVGGIALAFGGVVAAMVLVFGRSSGAHINPAVTIGFWSVGRFPRREVGPYILAQCVGSIAAASLLVAIGGMTGRAGATTPNVLVSNALLLEALLSFVLMFMIASISIGIKAPPLLASVAIGATVGLDAYLGGPLTGASMNPARSLGPALASGTWRAQWVYWIAPVGGMMAAIQAVELLRRHSTVTKLSRADDHLGVEGLVSSTADDPGPA